MVSDPPVSDPPVSDPPVSDPPAEPHVCGAYSPPCVLCVERDLSLYPRLAAFSRVVCRVCPAQHSDSACEHCFNLILYIFVKIILCLVSLVHGTQACAARSTVCAAVGSSIITNAGGSRRAAATLRVCRRKIAWCAHVSPMCEMINVYFYPKDYLAVSHSAPRAHAGSTHRPA